MVGGGNCPQEGEILLPPAGLEFTVSGTKAAWRNW